MSGANKLLLGADRALYQGNLPSTGMHCHPCPVLLMGLSGRFGLQFPDAEPATCRSALISAGVEHLFDPRGESVALIYLEPDAPESCALRPWMNSSAGVVWDPCSASRVRGVTDARLNHFDLPGLLGRTLPQAPPLEPRVARAMRYLRTHADRAPGRSETAALVHLSTSRFNHLFSAHAGASFRDYRVWSQLRAAIASMARHPRLTDAALEGAFVDSSHFSRRFRDTFGMTPRSVLQPLGQIARLY